MLQCLTAMEVRLLLAILTVVSAQCPNTSPCQCDDPPGAEGLLLINCRREGLTALPSFTDTSWSFSELTLYDNPLEGLGARGFTTQPSGQGLDIERLDLGKTMIQNIDPEAFYGIKELRQLVLHVNGMDSFPVTALHGLNNLYKLHLEGFVIKTLPDGALEQFPKLKSLSLSHCGLQNVTKSDFHTQQGELEYLDLSRNFLAHVPTYALGELNFLKTLYLSNNNILDLLSTSFAGNYNLEELDLSQNGFLDIAADAFDGLSRTLQTLKLSYTNFHQRDLQSLSYLSFLKSLDLSSNLISEIPDNTFAGLSNLQKLNLNRNHIQGLNIHSFTGLNASLTEFNIEFNEIKYIETGVFAKIQSLKILHLNDQNLSNVVNFSTFIGLEQSLLYLNLKETALTEQNLHAISNLFELKTLLLQKNSISQIPDGLFRNLHKLEDVYLDDNELEHVYQASFRGLHKSLRKIHLQNNNLMSLDECVFHEFERLSEVWLAGNPLLCDCNLRWLREWADTDNGSPKVLEAVCVSPPEHKGKNLWDIEPHQLVCAGETPPPILCEQDVSTTQLSTSYTMTTSHAVSTSHPTVTSEVTGPSSTLTTGTTTSASLPQLQVTVTAVTAEGFTVCWQLIDTMATPDLYFLVTVTPLSAQKPVFQENYEFHVRECDVEGLVPATEYEVCVTVIEKRSHDRILQSLDIHMEEKSPNSLVNITDSLDITKDNGHINKDANNMNEASGKTTHVDYLQRVITENQIFSEQVRELQSNNSPSDCVVVETAVVSLSPGQTGWVIALIVMASVTMVIIAILLAILIRKNRNKVAKTSKVGLCCHKSVVKRCDDWWYAGKDCQRHGMIEDNQQIQVIQDTGFLRSSHDPQRIGPINTQHRVSDVSTQPENPYETIPADLMDNNDQRVYGFHLRADDLYPTNTISNHNIPANNALSPVQLQLGVQRNKRTQNISGYQIKSTDIPQNCLFKPNYSMDELTERNEARAGISLSPPAARSQSVDMLDSSQRAHPKQHSHEGRSRQPIGSTQSLSLLYEPSQMFEEHDKNSKQHLNSVSLDEFQNESLNSKPTRIYIHNTSKVLSWLQTSDLNGDNADTDQARPSVQSGVLLQAGKHHPRSTGKQSYSKTHSTDRNNISNDDATKKTSFPIHQQPQTYDMHNKLSASLNAKQSSPNHYKSRAQKTDKLSSVARLGTYQECAPGEPNHRTLLHVRAAAMTTSPTPSPQGVFSRCSPEGCSAGHNSSLQQHDSPQQELYQAASSSAYGELDAIWSSSSHVLAPDCSVGGSDRWM